MTKSGRGIGGQSPPARAESDSRVGLLVELEEELARALVAELPYGHDAVAKATHGLEGGGADVDQHGQDGQLVAVEEGGTIRFVNSGVQALGKFLVIYQHYRLAVRDLDDEEAEGLIDDTEQAMRAVDAQAMVDAESYWSVIVEQMRGGFL